MLGGRWLKGKLARARSGQSQHDELRWGRSLIIAAFMMGLVLIASVVMIRHINHTERERCFDQLYREAIDIADYIEQRIARDREELELLSAVVARSDNLAAPELWQLINSFEQVGMMSDIALLLPDDTMIHGSGIKRNVKGRLSFAHEAALGAHISGRDVSVLNPEQFGTMPKYKPKRYENPRLVHYFVHRILHFRTLSFVHFYPISPAVLKHKFLAQNLC